MTARADIEDVHLRSALEPLGAQLSRSDVTDLYVNRGGELWLETIAGTSERHMVADLDDARLLHIARQVAALNDQAINREHPLLSGRLPDGSRIQIILPPATRHSPAFAIRKHAASTLALGDFTRDNMIAVPSGVGATRRRAAVQAVAAHLERKDMVAALAAAVRGKLNILISGGTSSGKTSFLSTLMREIPADERLLLIEDTPELQLGHANAVGLLAARSDLAEAAVSANDLVSAALRMRPDRILLGELRGSEAFAFLRAVNSGHPGSMTTVHADGADRAAEQVALLVLEAGTTLNRTDILHYVDYSIDLSVHLERGSAGRRISDIRIAARHRD